MIGVTLVQWPETNYNNNDINVIKDNKIEESDKILPPEEPLGHRLIGLLAVLASCFSSGFSGVYFEKLVKYTSQSLWIRNTQLAVFGVIISFMAMFLQDYDLVFDNGFFQVISLTFSLLSMFVKTVYKI